MSVRLFSSRRGAASVKRKILLACGLAALAAGASVAVVGLGAWTDGEVLHVVNLPRLSVDALRSATALGTVSATAR